MTDDLVFGPPLSADDFSTYLELGEYAFSEAPPSSPRLARLTEDEPDEPIYRVGRQSGEIVCRARIVPMGQWFGGRVVPMAAIGGVVVAAEHRSGGVGTALATDFIRVAHGRGLAISTLFPASLPIYRKVGYELAGASYHWEIPIGTTAAPRRVDDGIVVRRWAGGDFALRPLYDREASRTAGQLDRPPTFWSGVLESRNQAVHAYVAEQGDDPVGYITFTQAGKYDAERYIDVLDFVTTSRAATRALWRFVAGHSGTVSHVRLWGGATDTRLFDLPHRGQRILTVEPWMVRILDLPAALTTRGYAAGLEAELHLAYRDEIIPDNTGNWVVTIAHGRATAERGGDGRIRTTPAGLGPVYTGYLPAGSVTDSEILSGPAEDLDQLSTVFAGPTPWMADSF